jgi:hypothetical protein
MDILLVEYVLKNYPVAPLTQVQSDLSWMDIQP